MKNSEKLWCENGSLNTVGFVVSLIGLARPWLLWLDFNIALIMAAGNATYVGLRGCSDS